MSRRQRSIAVLSAAVILEAVMMVACAQGNDEPKEPATGSAEVPVHVNHVNRPSGVVIFETRSGEVKVEVEVVRTQRDIRRGLMYRTHLAANAGMLFLFKQEKIQSFWMMNTLISLDMIFIRADMSVAGVVANTVPGDKTSRFVNTPSQFVLEVNAGWAEGHGVVAGTPARFEAVGEVPAGVPLGG